MENNGMGVVHSGENCLSELILSNNINDGFRSTKNAIQDGVLQTITSTAQGTRDAMEATNRNGMSVTREVSDTARDNIRETSRVGTDLASQIGESRSSIERSTIENRLSMAMAQNALAGQISDSNLVNLVSSKDNFAVIQKEAGETREHFLRESARTREIFIAEICDVKASILKESCENKAITLEEGSKMRELSLKEFASLQLQACINKNDIEKEMLKGFSLTQLESLKLKSELAAQIAECCCEQKQEAANTRALILAQTAEAVKSSLVQANMVLAINKLPIVA